MFNSLAVLLFHSCPASQGKKKGQKTTQQSCEKKGQKNTLTPKA